MLRQAHARVLARAFQSQSSSIKPSWQTSRRLATVASVEKDPVELDAITTLPNGVRVATEALPGHFSGIGVYIDAGSRYENNQLRGVSHIIDRLAFKSTKRRSSDEMLETIDSLGGNIQCASSRESLMYQAATFNSAVSAVVDLLADTIRNPLITEEEVKDQLSTAEYEIGEIWSKPELILPELVHMTAYKDNTLGNPLLCPQERLDAINTSTVQSYRSTLYKPERMVVAFAGVNHEEAVNLTERYFGDIPKTQQSQTGRPETSQSTKSPGLATEASHHGHQNSSLYSTAPHEKSRLLSKIPFLKNLSTSATHNASVQPLDPRMIQPRPVPDLSEAAHYTGGFLALPPAPPSPNPAIPRLSHIHLAFEALPISSPDIYALATLQTLLGGGGSFSAGGPGKGMYSRLYTNVLNRHAWVESCVAFNHSYTDSGLFGIAASCIPSHIGNMLDVMCIELQALTLNGGPSALQQGEVQRAKNQLKSSLLMNLESRIVELEDLGRQVQVHGRKVGVKEMCRKIDSVTVRDLRRVASQVFGGMVQNRGMGTGAPTVVLQEDELESGKRKDFAWDAIQDRISSWKLGRRWRVG